MISALIVGGRGLPVSLSKRLLLDCVHLGYEELQSIMRDNAARDVGGVGEGGRWDESWGEEGGGQVSV